MAEWYLVPCLVRLRADLNSLCPDRDKRSDGTIGDAAHQHSVSDHNDDEIGRVPIRDADRNHEVHAYDADHDLRMPGLTMEMVIQHILRRCRNGTENRLRYIIYNRRIWEASNNWRQRTYTGKNAHTEHAHFSSSYESAREANTASWRLEEIPVALTQDDKNWLSDKIADAAMDAAQAVWKYKLNVKVGKDETPSWQEAGSILRYTSSEHHRIEDKIDALSEKGE